MECINEINFSRRRVAKKLAKQVMKEHENEIAIKNKKKRIRKAISKELKRGVPAELAKDTVANNMIKASKKKLAKYYKKLQQN